jgi:hypothetical protein
MKAQLPKEGMSAAVLRGLSRACGARSCADEQEEGVT